MITEPTNLRIPILVGVAAAMFGTACVVFRAALAGGMFFGAVAFSTPKRAGLP